MKVCRNKLHSYSSELKRCPECLRLKANRWSSANSEKQKANHARWRKTSPEKGLINLKTWRAENPGKHNAQRAKRRSTRLNATPKWLTREQLKQIQCYYIVAKWIGSILGDQIDVDHVIPLQGDKVTGLHVPWNLQLMIHTENCSKGNKIV